MYVPDNYSRFEIEEQRLFNSQYTCECCNRDFYYEDMYNDCICEECQYDLEQLEIWEEDEEC